MSNFKHRKIGLAIFWFGTAYLFFMSWAIMWWLIPKYRYYPPEHTAGTILEIGGPVFNLAFMAIPIGVPLMAAGLLFYAEKKKSHIWIPIVICAFLILTTMFPSKLDYHPAVFGIFGGLIIVLFIATLWFWAKSRANLQGHAKSAADYRLVSYIFFLNAAANANMLLSNPFFGLYYPDKLLEAKEQLMPLAYSAGIKLALAFALGFLFALLSQYKTAKDKTVST
ncbi:MAG: hypothetical protein ACYSWP_17975 [Planctomycetota bacterium]|jgi:hypothetical protein